jgi:hypothetical protein
VKAPAVPVLSIPKGVCLRAAADRLPCKWPRCACRVDLVYKAGTSLPKRA